MPDLRYNVASTRPELLESLWVLSRRFMALNVLTPLEFTRLFRRDPPMRPSALRASTVYDRIDLDKMAPWIGHTRRSVVALMPDVFEFSKPLLRLGPVKLCPECAEQGYHSVLHEVQWLEYCPIHRRRLSEHCFDCGRRLMHVTRFRLGESPNQLPCGHRWTSANVRSPPQLDASECFRLGTWLRRLHTRGGDEQWLALALGQSGSLVAGDEDFRELLELFSGMAGFSRLVQRPLIRSLGLKKWTRPSLPQDWFERFLAEAGRYAAELYESEWRSVYLAFQLRDAVKLLQGFGKRKLVSVVRNSLQIVDLRSRTFVRIDLQPADIELIAATFLRKHLFLNTQGEPSEMDAWQYLRRAMRFSAQPLGLLRRNSGESDLYWSPVRYG